ncbi:MAG: endolytic transglycosylase MltG [Firmicutes bacterium]|nr:endolytic transglycosylase MltG [Bacillota bacterium]
MEFRAQHRPVLLLVLATLAVLVGGLVFFQVNLMLRPASPGAPVPRVVEVPQGATAGKIAEILESSGVIRNAFVFRLLAEYRGLDGKIRAGEYELNAAMSPAEILEYLVKGPILTRPFTVREGLTVLQIAESLASQGVVNKEAFLKAARDRSVVADLAPPGVNLKEPLEGYLSPETYRIRKGTAETEVVALMVQRFRDVFNDDFRVRAKQIGMRLHDVVTLASIIEKEAVVDEERPLISGVFHNRLRIGMKLDADPTVRYATGKFSGPVTLDDTKAQSPYNTYRQPGLPPGPIAAPGTASIRAALYPAETKYLYFVAKNDGTHHFSMTLREHINAINKYRPYGL